MSTTHTANIILGYDVPKDLIDEWRDEYSGLSMSTGQDIEYYHESLVIGIEIHSVEDYSTDISLKYLQNIFDELAPELKDIFNTVKEPKFMLLTSSY